MLKHGYKLAILALAVMFGTCGCIRGMAEKQIVSKLPDLIGPAQSYNVHLSANSTMALIQGNINQLEISGFRVKIKDNPVINQLNITSKDIKYHKKLQAIGTTTFNAQIMESDLNDYLNSKKLPLQKAQINLQNSKLILQGNYPIFLDQTVPIKLEGNFEMKDETKVNLNINRLNVANIGIPEFALNMLEQKINPLTDLQKAKLPLFIKILVIVPGGLSLQGEVRIDPAKYQ
jgi:hypothetical protein